MSITQMMKTTYDVDSWHVQAMRLAILQAIPKKP